MLLVHHLVEERTKETWLFPVQRRQLSMPSWSLFLQLIRHHLGELDFPHVGWQLATLCHLSEEDKRYFLYVICFLLLLGGFFLVEARCLKKRTIVGSGSTRKEKKIRKSLFTHDLICYSMFIEKRQRKQSNCWRGAGVRVCRNQAAIGHLFQSIRACIILVNNPYSKPGHEIRDCFVNCSFLKRPSSI
mgnify:CR=1 FL=1